MQWCKMFFGSKEDKDALDSTDVIGVINELQNKLTSKGKMVAISLPQIVVVGSQSSGKSSVLESVIGKEFLPRGTGVVTRRPTVIQLQPSKEEYVQFLHCGEEKFTDFEAVREEILSETNKDPGPTGFSSKPINLKIYAQNVLKLTLVDLPGIIKVAVGEQREESVDEVHEMVRQYIEQPHTIILAICPANTDLSTCDALQVAKLVDPNYERTMGVLTKLDLMDKGTNAAEILKNKVLPLAQGYVGIVNRSQQDIEHGTSIEEAIKREKVFLESTSAYSSISHLHGSHYLQKRLHVLLQEHIRNCLPSVRKEIVQKLDNLKVDIGEFDKLMSPTGGHGAAQSYVIRHVQRIIDELHVELFGNSETVPMDRMIVGSIINFNMHTELKKILDVPIPLSETDMARLIANSNAIRNTLSVPSITLEAAVSGIVATYKEPLDDFVASTTDLLIAAVRKFSTEVKKFPTLRNELQRLVEEAIDRCTGETKYLIANHLKAEAGCFNFDHEDMNFEKEEELLPNAPFKFSAGNEKLLPNAPIKIWAGNEKLPENKSDIGAYSDHISKELSKNNEAKRNTSQFTSIVERYMKLVKKQISDVAIKYVVVFLVKGVSKFIRNELISTLLGSERFLTVLEECKKDFDLRDQLQRSCNDLESALSAIRSF